MHRVLNRSTRGAAVLALAAASVFAGRARGGAPSTQPSTGDIQSQIQALQAQVAQLQAQQQQSDAAVKAAVLKDADRRSTFSLTDSGLPFAGNYQEGKFVLKDEQGNFTLHPWFQLQLRDASTYRERVSKADSDHDFENGFELRRMKIGFDGNAFSPTTTYFIDWNTDRNAGTLSLEEAWVRGKIADDWYLRGGQMKDPFAHESLVSSKKLLGTEISYITDVLAGGSNYVQAATLAYQHEALQVEGGLTDGFNSINNNFQDFPTNTWNWGAAGRVNYKVFGDWGAYDQFTSWGDKHDLLVFGGGVDYSEGGDTDQFLHTVDVQYNRVDGWGAYAAYYGRYTKNAPRGVTAAATHDTYDWGFIVQGSYLIPQTQWEPFARYDYIKFDDDTVAAGARDTVHEITLGVNYYLHGHAAKFTLDASYLPNGTPTADTASDVLASPDSEVVARAQFQFLL